MDDGTTRTGHPAGKRSVLACGDDVRLNDDGRVIEVAERRSLLFRSDAYRQKLIAANATQIAIVVACEPAFSDALVSRALVAAESQGLRALIVLNKIDLNDAVQQARASLAPFRDLPYPIIEMSAKGDVMALRNRLRSEHTVLVGQSGMGKSTLVNALVPNVNVWTQSISTALGSGKHTTTSARRYALGDGATLTDSPGLQAFGLAHLSRAAIEAGFIEIGRHNGECRYRDCTHDHEPGCVVRELVAQGGIHARRLAHFHSLLAEPTA